MNKQTDKKGTVIPMKKGDRVSTSNPLSINIAQSHIVDNIYEQPMQGSQYSFIQPPHHSQILLRQQPTHLIQDNSQPTFGRIQNQVQFVQNPTYPQPPVLLQQSYLTQKQPALIMSPSITSYVQPPVLLQQSFIPQQQPTLIVKPSQPLLLSPPKEYRTEYVEKKRTVTRMVEQEIEEIIPVEMIRIEYQPIQTIVEKVPVPVNRPYYVQKDVPIPFPKFVSSSKPEQIVRHVVNFENEDLLNNPFIDNYEQSQLKRRYYNQHNDYNQQINYNQYQNDYQQPYYQEYQSQDYQHQYNNKPQYTKEYSNQYQSNERTLIKNQQQQENKNQNVRKDSVVLNNTIVKQSSQDNSQ